MTIVTSSGAAPIGAAPRGVRGRLARRRAEEAAELQASRLVSAWIRTAAGAGLGSDALGSGVIVPAVMSVNLAADPVRLLVRLLPGQVVADLVAVADRLAEGLAVPRVRITQRGHGFARVELLRAEPLCGLVDFPGPVRSVAEPVLLGRTETGADLRRSLVDSGHAIVQGQTRSGKSAWCYSLLGQLADAPDLTVAGCDPSGLLLGPWAARRPSWVSLGTAGGAEAHLAVLDALVAEMDRRMASLPSGCDKLPISEATPLVLVVLEELPGLLRLAGTAPKPPAGQPKVAERIQSQLGRLLAESAKVAMRVLLVCQRADASIIGGYERAQCSLRISFAVDTADAVKMLHPQVQATTIADHATAPKGVALLTGPELPLARIRGPYLHGEYSAYCRLITEATP